VGKFQWAVWTCSIPSESNPCGLTNGPRCCMNSCALACLS